MQPIVHRGDEVVLGVPGNRGCARDRRGDRVVDVSEESQGRPGPAGRQGRALIRLQCRILGTLRVNSGIGASKRVPSSATS